MNWKLIAGVLLLFAGVAYIQYRSDGDTRALLAVTAIALGGVLIGST